MHEVPAVTTHLPQAVVRVGPVAFEEVQQRALQIPGVLVGSDAGFPRQVQPVEDLTPHVELELPGRGITLPHGYGALIAGQPVQGVFRQAAGAVDAVHDLQIRRVTGHGAQQPFPPRLGLGDEPGTEQGLQREGGVA